MGLKKKFNEFICSKRDHEWAQIPGARTERTKIYVCKRCGKQMQIVQKEHI